MANDSNLYQAYKLAHQDKAVLFKNSLLAILIVACFSLGSLFFLGFLQNFSVGNLVLTCSFLIIGLSLLPIFFLIIPIRDFLLWNLAISLAPFIPLLFSQRWNQLLWIIISATYLVCLAARIVIKGEFNDLLDLKWIRIIGKGSFYILLALAIILSALVYFQGKPGLIEQEGMKTLDSVLSRGESIQLPFGVEFSGTIDDILENYIAEQTPDLGEFDSIDENLLTQAKLNLSQFLDYPVTGKEKLSSLVVEWIKSRWQTLSSTLKIGLSIIALLIILSFLKLFNIIFSVILVAVSWVFLQILLSLKYLKIKRVGVEKQEIIIA